MSSSTSSSRRMALYTMLIAAVTLLPAMGLVNWLTRSAEAGAGDIFGIQRIRSVIDSLDYMAATEGNTLLFIGSSLVKDGFSPRIFDATVQSVANKEVTSFNVGMGNMKPSYLKLLVQRIADTYAAQGRRADVVLLEFNPFLVTQAREQFRPFMTEQVQAMLMSPQQVGATFWQDPERFARLVSIKYLRHGVSAEAITGGLRFLVGQAQAQAPLMAQLTEDQLNHLQQLAEFRSRLNQYIREEQPISGKSHVWNPVTQGGLIDMMDLSPQAQEVAAEISRQMRHPKAMAMDLQSRIQCCDIENLTFNDKLVGEFLDTVDSARRFSDRVEIVLLPRNRQWVQLSPAGQARLQALLQQLQQRTGVTIRNYQEHGAFDGSDFYDVSHLSMDKGRPLFSSVLARDLAATFETLE
ncbi:hypothetical protein [Ketobacter sp.]|uniref:hypothetical protein n=1 Tax=Ketobacter sp. TaxID=2083498 RepID=UPI0025C30333|nr:hypothetical protein [Ketobacter sp.]